jgi:hypothetical protein
MQLEPKGPPSGHVADSISHIGNDPYGNQIAVSPV